MFFTQSTDEPKAAESAPNTANRWSANARFGDSAAPYGGGEAPRPTASLFPPSAFSTTSPHAATANTCAFTVEQLDAYLRTSDYGQNESVFRCYFTKETSDGPPLCLVCRRPLPEHRSAAETPVMGAATAPAQPAAGAAAALFTALGAFPIAMASAPTTPGNLKVGDEYDEVDASFSPLWVLCCVGAIMFTVGTILLVVFGVSGLIKLAPPVIVAPCIFIVIGFAFFAVQTSTTILIRKRRPGRGSVEPAILITRRRLVCACCPRRNTYLIRDLNEVALHGTNVSVNHRPIFQVRAKFNNGESVPLFAGDIIDTQQQLINWRAYFSALQAHH